MPLPRVTSNDLTERAGVIKVAGVVNDAGCIWRETLMRDVGIDGQIEHVLSNGEVTGRIVAVQVKSGSSRFAGETDSYVPFRVDDTHADYWRKYPLPVILVLHDPGCDLTIWTDARAALAQGTQSIRVPRVSRFDVTGVGVALASDGPLPAQVVPLGDLIQEMIAASTGNPRYELSYFDLFCYGMTDVAFSLYFGMDLADEIAEAKAVRADLDVTELTQDSFAFIDDYVGYLVAHDLARIDFDAWRQAAHERQMVGHFIAPLTRRGRALVSAITERDVEILGPSGGYNVVIQERFVAMQGPGPAFRMNRVEAFKQAVRGE